MKQETLEESAENYVDSFEYGIAHPRRVCKNAFINGAKWQQERMYSEEEVNTLITLLKTTTEYEVLQSFRDKIKQFKKK